MISTTDLNSLPLITKHQNQISGDQSTGAVTAATGEDEISDEDSESYTMEDPVPIQTEPSIQTKPVPRREGSIIKPYSKKDLYINEKKRCIGKIDLTRVLKDTVDAQEKRLEANIDQPTLKKRVSFHQITFRTFDQCIGDNPSVSYGTPISLDWDFKQHEPIDMDEYELNRPPRRKLRQLLLNYYNRRNILIHHFGVSEQDLEQAEKQANKIKQQRAITRAFLPASFLEAAVESCRRKTKKMLLK